MGARGRSARTRGTRRCLHRTQPDNTRRYEQRNGRANGQATHPTIREGGRLGVVDFVDSLELVCHLLGRDHKLPVSFVGR